MGEGMPTAEQVKRDLQNVRDNLDFLIQYQASWSILIRARYDSLRKVGFDKRQALEIIKARGTGA
jgi:hypothetical protein